MTRRRSRSSSSEESVPVENASKSPAPAAVLVPAQPAVESPFEDPAAGVPKQAHKEAPAHKEEKKKDKEDKKKGREKKSRSRRRRERSGSKEKHRGRSQEKKKPSRSKTHKEKKEKKPQGKVTWLLLSRRNHLRQLRGRRVTGQVAKVGKVATVPKVSGSNALTVVPKWRATQRRWTNTVFSTKTV